MINEAISFIRKNKRHQTEPLEQEIAATQQEKSDCTDLKKALALLKPEERTVIILRYFEDMKLEEIADILGESLSTVKSRLYRTLNKLKLDLQEI